MSASLVGSEMCIRDRGAAGRRLLRLSPAPKARRGSHRTAADEPTGKKYCLLYTSDAADDM
eukprot:5448656-Alexandrium_andersonii.AAC.1